MITRRAQVDVLKIAMPPLPTSLTLYQTNAARRRVPRQFASDKSVSDLVILLDAPLIVKAFAAVLVKHLAEQFHKTVDETSGLQVNQCIERLEIVAVDAPVSNPADVVNTIRENNDSARLVAFFVDSPLIDASAWLKVGVDVHSAAGFSFAEMVSCLSDLFVNNPVGAPGVGVISLPSMKSRINLPRTNASQSVSLTAREAEVIVLIAAGESNKAIARLLNISLSTVKTHVHNLLCKLGVDRRIKLALWREGQFAPNYQQVTKDDLRITAQPSGKVAGNLAV